SFSSSPPGPPACILFPYTTLFRSRARVHQELSAVELHVARAVAVADDEGVHASRAVEHALDAVVEAAREVEELFADEPGEGEQRSEEHTSELQSRENLVCRLLLEK